MLCGPTHVRLISAVITGDAEGHRVVAAASGYENIVCVLSKNRLRKKALARDEDGCRVVIAAEPMRAALSYKV